MKKTSDLFIPQGVPVEDPIDIQKFHKIDPAHYNKENASIGPNTVIYRDGRYRHFLFAFSGETLTQFEYYDDRKYARMTGAGFICGDVRRNKTPFTITAESLRANVGVEKGVMTALLRELADVPEPALLRALEKLVAALQ